MQAYNRFFPLLLALAAGSATGANHTVQVGQNGLGQTANAFNPQTVNISPGDTVTFINNSGGFHNAVSDDGGATFSSGAASGAAWTYTTPPLNASIGFHCTVHGSAGSGMFGTIVLLVPVRLQSFEVD